MPNASLLKEFESLIGKENVLTSEADRQCYSYDATPHAPVVPELVLRPTRVEELGPLIKRCYSVGFHIVVRGSGTNLSGGVVPDNRETVVILTNALNRILEINTEDCYAVVEPGVVTARFAEEVRKAGLFYPPDPSSMSVSTLGGNVAENAGGLRGLKYGVTKDYLLGLDFYDAEGQLIKTGSRTVKCATGYNLAGLLTGSEGTIGVMSRLIMRLVPPPKAAQAMKATFASTVAAAEAVAGIIAAHIVPCTLEFLDNVTLNRIEDFKGIGLPRDAAAMLLVEVDGHPAQVKEEAEAVCEVLRQCGGDVQMAGDAKERDAVWEARRLALPSLARMRPTCILEDATVPRSKLPALMTAIDGIASRYRLELGVFGHAGDGNMHPTFMCDKRDKDEMERVESAIAELFEQTIALGGTLSGEHGTGITKSRWLELEVGEATLAFCRKMRRAFDPKGLFNSSKIIGV